MSEADETSEKVEIDTKSLVDLANKLEGVSNSAWAAAQSLKMIAKASEGIEKVQKMMFSPLEVKKEPSKEAREKLESWFWEEDI